MKNLGYYNGIIDEQEKIMIPMLDRASWFGDGVYDAGPAIKGKMFAVREHIDRFFRNAAWLEIEMPLSKDELESLLEELLKKVDSNENLVYMQVTRGTGIRNHVYTEGPGNLWITIRENHIIDNPAPRKTILCEDDRWFHNDIKTINLISAVRHSEEAKKAGCFESILVRPGGIVTECAHSNVHIIKNGAFITHPTDNMILPGIARAHLIANCKRLGISVLERPFMVSELFDADEVIISSSSNPCIRVNEIDGKPVGMKAEETFKKLFDAAIAEFDALRK